jgi:hypothetical protein
LARKKIAKDPSESILPPIAENSESMVDWKEGLKLNEAFEITADLDLLHKLRNLPQGRNLVPPDLYKNPEFKKDEFDHYKISLNKQDRLLFKRLETNFIKKLKSGSLVAKGNKQDDYGGAQFQISPEQWQFLIPRYRDSTAHSPQDPSESPSIIHILVFQSEGDSNLDDSTSLLPSEFYKSGFAGRPSLKDYFIQEMERRASEGEMRNSLNKEAEALREWAKEAHPNFIPTPKISTIKNGIRERHRELKSSNHLK